LRVNRKIIGIEENDGFEENPGIGLDIGFREKFEFIANEFDTLSMGTIDGHHIGFEFFMVVLINFI
jgi:hypothetical protein